MIRLLALIGIMCLVWQVAYATEVTISPEQLTLFDESRARSIPIMIYKPVSATTEHRPVAIISHGHTIRNSEYSFLANALVKQGYVVVSIQHDLEDDPELPTTGILVERRKPLWDRGIQNIMFVLSMLKETQPTLDLDKVILIGHSNGGDISMLFATTHPKLVAKVVSLDSLRVPFPTKNHIPLLSLRANDKKADEGVLPKSGANIIKLKNAKHIDMCDRGSDEVKQEINKFIIAFLQNS